MTADRRELVAVFAGGALGTIARAELAELIVHDPGSWPWATFAVNIVAAALLGYFTTRMHKRPPLSAYRRPLLGPGLCGGLSTFATMQSELLGMLDAGHVGLALAYASVSLAVGLLVVSLTTRLTRHSGVTA